MNVVQELRTQLLKLKKPNYSNIDSLMRRLMRRHNVSAKELHYGFRKAHKNQTPDEYVKRMKTYEEFIEQTYSILVEGKGSRGEDTQSSEKLAGYIGRRAARNPHNTDKYWQGVLRLKSRSPVGSKILQSAKDSRARETRKLNTEDYLYEMRKEDKVRGKKKTPLYITRTKKTLIPASEGDKKKWKLNVVKDKTMSPEASGGRFRAGLTRSKYEFGHELPPHTRGPQERSGEMYMGRLRGKKKREQREILPKPTPDSKESRQRDLYFKQNPESAITPETKSLVASMKTGFTQASKKWSKQKSKPSTPKPPSTRQRMAAAADRLGLK
jgi:hypothetical protein